MRFLSAELFMASCSFVTFSNNSSLVLQFRLPVFRRFAPLHPLSNLVWSQVLGYDSTTMLRHQVNFFIGIEHTNIHPLELQAMKDTLSMTCSNMMLNNNIALDVLGFIDDSEKDTAEYSTYICDMDCLPPCPPHEEMLLCYEFLN